MCEQRLAREEALSTATSKTAGVKPLSAAAAITAASKRAVECLVRANDNIDAAISVFTRHKYPAYRADAQVCVLCIV
jgi:hypothetical protein